ncbi:MAG: hypothetical protein QM606_05575, partial [Leucobacter sp.]
MAELRRGRRRDGEPGGGIEGSPEEGLPDAASPISASSMSDGAADSMSDAAGPADGGAAAADDGAAATDGDAAETPPADSGEIKKAKRGWTGTRLVALIAAVAVVSLLAGVAVMQFIVSPAEIAARTAPPEPGPVTAPVEKRVIENTIVSRGEVTYADAVDVTIDAAGGEDRPVITGHVPEVGDVLTAGSIALELAGRPVIVLPGALPAYRTLSVGMRGPDVVQLKTALNSMGFGAGDASSDVFEYDTAVALGALYEQSGYDPANGGQEAQMALRDAERAVRDANTAVAQAQAALDEAANAPVPEGQSRPSLIGEQAALNAAWEALSDAQEALVTAQEGVLPRLPSSEALFLGDLPRRVDLVSVARGDILSGSPMSVSGATLTIVGTLSKQDADLLKEGTEAFYPGPDDEELTAKVAKIEAPKSGGESSADQGENDGQSGDSGAQSSDRYTVTLDPGELTPEQIDAMRGTNVRVRLPIA